MADGQVAPLSDSRAASLNTWETRPMSTETMIWVPLLTAIPADS